MPATMNNNPGDFLICSAWEPEQRVLRHLCGEALESQPSDKELALMNSALKDAVTMGTLPPATLSFCLLGTGSMSAAVTLGGLLGERRGKQIPLPRSAFFVGTAGALRDGPHGQDHIPFAARVSEVSWFDLAEASNLGYVPRSQHAEVLLGSSRNAEDERGTHGACVSTWAISRTLPNGIHRPGWLENLELYGFALTCQRFGIPWNAWVGVSNWIGPSAHEEWRDHHLTASVLAQARFYAAAFGGGSSSNP